MKVYVVFYGGFRELYDKNSSDCSYEEEKYIEKIFDTKEKAVEYSEKMKKLYSLVDYPVEEYEVY